jgi:hypothetical protein
MSARRVSWVRGAGVCCLAALAIVASGGIYRWLPGGGRLRVRGTVIVGGGGEPLSNLFERLPRNPSNDLRRFKRSERNAPPPKSCGAGAISGLFKGLMRLIEVSATHKLATRPPATPMVPTMRERRRMAVAISAARVLDTSCWITTAATQVNHGATLEPATAPGALVLPHAPQTAITATASKTRAKLGRAKEIRTARELAERVPPEQIFPS